jgi:TolB protein
MVHGPLDTVAGRDGAIVFASDGWLWRLDPVTRVATRLTADRGVDSRPALSPDGTQMAFLLDDGATISLMLRSVANGEARRLDRGMVLDPVFTPDGAAIVYSSASAGDLDLWRVDIATGARTRLTTGVGLELRPQITPDGGTLVYVSKTRAGGDQVRVRTLADGTERTIVTGQILSLLRPALSPDGSTLVYAMPGSAGWELWLTSLSRPAAPLVLLRRPNGRPLTPNWSADGTAVLFTEAGSQQVAHLYRIPATGGAAREITVTAWDHAAPTGTLIIETRMAKGTTLVPARLGIRDEKGHPLIASTGMPRFDGQSGQIYSYSRGRMTLTVPAGRVTVSAVRGLTTPLQRASVTIGANDTTRITFGLDEVWSPSQHGWYAGDHHFHLNYGGGVYLRPNDLSPLLEGEGLDVGTPMLANLANRFEDQDLFPVRRLNTGPLVIWSQEVRSHFLGHVGLIGSSELFWPWVWGPGYEVYGRDDRSNAEPLAFGRAHGGAGVYVHPIANGAAPVFSERGMPGIPVGLIADAALGNINLLELVCLWSSSRGTTDLWYTLLNAGIVINPSGGTDAMTDLHRTMTVGSTRVYVRPDGPLTWPSYLSALTAGKSFVTTGPMLDFRVDGAQPGDVIARADRRVSYSLTVASAVPIDSITIIVNGRAAYTHPIADTAQIRSLRGTIRVPAGGWIAARVTGPATREWPAMADAAFAHTAPIWLGRRGSTTPSDRRTAAHQLLAALKLSTQRIEIGYTGTPTPRLLAHQAQAAAVLERLLR